VKVFHLITTIDLGGAEQQLCILVEEQVRNGIRVEVIPLKGEVELLNKLRNLGAAVNLDFLNKNPVKQLAAFKRYFKKNVGIIHAHLPRAEIISAFSKGKNTLVISKHNAEIFIPNGNPFLSRLLSRIVLARATDVIAISNAVRDFLERSKELNESTRVTVIYYGFKTNENTNSCHPQGHFLLGTVSRLVEQKDIPTLLRAFALVSQKIPNARLQVLGIGPLRDQLFNLAADLDITTRVDWLGKSEKVIDLMSSWSVFALTSKYEGFGLVLLEAMSARVPIVASNISAIPEVLGNDSRQLFDPGDHRGLAEKILDLTDSLTRENIIRAQTLRLTCFSAVKMESEIRRIYAQSRS
jgi:glycosyltransferase involved in cell wall biosynthesis